MTRVKTMQATSLLDGVGEEFAALLSDSLITSQVPDGEPEPGTTATPVVYSCPFVPGPDQLQGTRKRVDELADGDIIGCAVDGAPGLHLFDAPRPIEGRLSDAEGTKQYLIEGTRDGERPGEKHVLWGSQVVTVVPATGWTQAHFCTWRHSKCKVFTAEHADGLRVERVSYSGIEVKIGGKRTTIAYADITGMGEWGIRHVQPSEDCKNRAMDEADKYYGWRGGKHPFRPTFAASVRCKDCAGSIRSNFHTGIRNADHQQFEKLRMDVLRPTQTNVGRTSGTELLDRYVRGIPLIRYERDSDVRWTFVCPVECGGGIWIGWSTLRGLREGWFKHCREKHPQDGPRYGNWQHVWNPTWPSDQKIEPGIVFRPGKPGRASVERPVEVTLRVPKDDPSWARVVARLAEQGRSMVLQEADGTRRHPRMTVTFTQGAIAAREFRAALECGGIPRTDITLVNSPTRRTPLAECLATVCDPNMVQRSTGTVRDGEMFCHLDEQSVIELEQLPRATDQETDELELVKAVILHRGSRKAIVIGLFHGLKEAERWWNQGFNRFKRDQDVEFIVLDRTDDDEPRPPARPGPDEIAEPREQREELRPQPAVQRPDETAAADHDEIAELADLIRSARVRTVKAVPEDQLTLF